MDKIPPIHRLKKAEIVWLSTHYCQHGHSYLQHYSCYYTENPTRRERVGFFDIEASNLDADFGTILSWAILDDATDRVETDHITEADLKAGREDARIVRSGVDTIRKYDRLVTYYGARFDIPFIRARAAIDKVPFPVIGTIKHTDLYFTIKARYKISSRRQENACRVVLGTTEKTRLDGRYWNAALRGEPKALSYVVDHNIKDVRDLKKLFHAVKDFSRRTDTSI